MSVFYRKYTHIVNQSERAGWTGMIGDLPSSVDPHEPQVVTTGPLWWVEK